MLRPCRVSWDASGASGWGALARGVGFPWFQLSEGRGQEDTGSEAEERVKRLRSEIITSGTGAMNLQATGGESYVDLSWAQDDFDLLGRFNPYRATSPDGPYSRINRGLIPRD